MSLLRRYCCFGAILVYIVTSIVAYNFDVDNVILYEDLAKFGTRGSYFGYSVALWNPGNGNLSDSWMFVGAPRANSSALREVNEPGTVFRCKIGEQCSEWVLNSRANNRPTDGSWLGGTMNVENKSDPEVLVCGPRWIDRNQFGNDASLTRAGMLGMCYSAMASNLSAPPNPIQRSRRKTSPFSGKVGFPLQEIGFSVHMNPEGSPPELILGCPRPMNEHGIPIRFIRSRESNFIVPSISQNKIDDTDYSGYAITSGKYFNPRKRVYAIGAPRGASLHGSVDLFDFPLETKKRMKIHLTKTGEQLGEYFGAALASCDIDGDKKDDLLVGAPQWTKTLDEGRVYIFRQIDAMFPDQFMKRDHREGKMSRGRFGSAITCLGDIDYDGYADVAIGAPYEGNGAVYIFHGGKNGLTLNPQKIAGPEATRGFGISISEPRDVDSNGFADIAVGAYLSGHVTLIRSKRVVTMKMTMSHNIPDKQLNRTAETFSLYVCSSYGGAHLPQELSVIQELRIDQMYRRAKVEMEGKLWTAYSHSEILKSGLPESCRNYTIKIHKTVSFDYLKPLQLSVSQRLKTNEKNGTLVINSDNIFRGDNFNTSDAVMMGNLDRIKSFLEIQFGVDCDSNTCLSNLSVEMTTDLINSTYYVIGSKAHPKLIVKVHNSGDHAYLAKVRVHIPSFIGVFKKPSTCDKTPKNKTHIEIVCKIGDPLAENGTVIFSVDLDMSNISIDTKHIKFEAVAETSSDNIGSGNNKISLLINSVIEADIGISGKTNKDWYSFMRTQEAVQVSDIIFSHTYGISNSEATPLGGALLSISIPTHWIHADEEIEIVKLNKTEGDLDGEQFTCQSLDEASDIPSLSYDASTMPEWLLGENSSQLTPHSDKQFTIVGGKLFSVFPDTKTLHINTSNPLVKWKTIDCIIRPFKTARSAAQVVLTFDLLLSNLPREIIQDKEIIFFATNGSTKITVPPNFVQSVNKKPDVVMVGTTFVGSTSERQAATWVISVLVGLLLLIIIIFALFKFGFFKRSKKAKLEASMRQSGTVVPRILIETGSSTEALDTT